MENKQTLPVTSQESQEVDVKAHKLKIIKYKKTQEVKFEDDSYQR